MSKVQTIWYILFSIIPFLCMIHRRKLKKVQSYTNSYKKRNRNCQRIGMAEIKTGTNLLLMPVSDYTIHSVPVIYKGILIATAYH